jgi:uncharacterized caspase-like protein
LIEIDLGRLAMRAAALLALVGALFSVAGNTGALAEKRVALVIGNANYANAPKLINPVNDTTAVSIMLEGLGFEVQMRNDLANADMRKAVRDFSDQTKNADIAVVYYAGHGIEVNGNNYLVPIDAKLQRDIDVEDEAVAVDRVMQMIEPARKLRLVILDACRDNPLSRTMQRTLAATRGTGGNGLAPPAPASAGTLVAFAARAGSTVSDGAGANSPFTTALVKHLTTPDLDVRIALGRVRDEVIKDTDSKQEPYVYGSLGGDQIMLARSTPAEASETAASATAPVAAVPTPAGSSLDGDAWRDYELAARLNTIPVWDEFLKTHSTGFIGNLARGQRAKLLAEPPAAAAPAPAAVAAIPPEKETKTRTLSREEPPSRRERRREARRGRGGEGGGGDGSSGCGAAKRTLRAAMALGFDNRDGVITAVHAKCGR